MAKKRETAMPVANKEDSATQTTPPPSANHNNAEENTSTDYESESSAEFRSDVAANSTENAPRTRKPYQFKNAGLVFPPVRVIRHLKLGKYAKNILKSAGVYLASVLEYVTGELLEGCVDQATYKKKKRITPKHVHDAIKHDLEFSDILKNVIIPGGGVLPFIHQSLLPINKKGSPQRKTNRQLELSSDDDE